MTVANKRIRVSDDSGSNWYTLPGNTGSIQDQAGTVDDTVFGQAYKSAQPTSIDGKITANAFFKGFAGYVATLKKAGSTTAATGEATSNTTGLRYQITNAAKRVIDRTVAVVVKDDGSAVAAADILSIDYLFGIVEFVSGYTVAGAITLDYSYLPLASIANSNAFTLTQTADAVDISDFDTLQGNSGHKVYQQGLKTVSLEVKGFYNASNNLQSLLDSRAELIIEINPDGSSQSVARGFFRPSNLQLQGNAGAVEESTVQFQLTVPSDDLMELPFKWLHNATTLPVGLQKSLDAWVSGDAIGVQYLPDGTNGYEADSCIVTEMTLTGGLDAMNTFAATFQISGTQSSVP